MSLETPTVASINLTIIAQIESSINQTIPLLPKSFIRVFSKTFAGVFILLYKYAGFIFLQLFVKTATIEDVTVLGKTIKPLVEWGRLIGVGDPARATQAELVVQVTVEAQGETLTSGTQLLNSTNGVTYLTVGSVLLDAASLSVVVRASSDQGGGDGTGIIGNLSVGQVVAFVNPIASVARDTIVTAQSVTGAESESTELYRARVFERFQKRVQGGALVDYEVWGEELAGIVSVYPYTGASPGHVDSYVEATSASSGSADGIPTQAQLNAVKASMELDTAGLATRRPAGSFTNVYAITRVGFDVTVFGLAAENVAVVKSEIDAAITQYFIDRQPFVSGVTLPPRADLISKSALIGEVNSIVSAINGTFTNVTFNVSSNAANLNFYSLGIGEKSKLANPVAYL